MNNGHVELHEDLERELSAWLGTDDAIIYTSGYLANVGCISTLVDPRDTVICDVGDHASILEGAAASRARMRPVRHGRLDLLESALAKAAGDGGGVLVVVDGVFSMEGDVCDVPAVTDLCRRYGARLLVDEAHGVGVLGADGAGACSSLGVGPSVDLRMGTFSKTLAGCGGFIAGPSAVVDYLRAHSRAFIFAASSVPAALGATLAAVRICCSDEGPELFAAVRSNAAYLRAGLNSLGFDVLAPTRLADQDVVTGIVPVKIGDDWSAARMWSALYARDVFVNVAVHPAVPHGRALLRTSVMSTHTAEHLDRALEAFADAGRECGVLGERLNERSGAT
jgi:8-amino-7-oxononanoate synthase